MKSLRQTVAESCSASYKIDDFDIAETKYGTWRISGTIKGCRVSQVVRTKPTPERAKEALIACYTFPNN